MATTQQQYLAAMIKMLQDQKASELALAKQIRDSTIASLSKQYNLGKTELGQQLNTNLKDMWDDVNNQMMRRGLGRSTITTDTGKSEESDLRVDSQNKLAQLLAQLNSGTSDANNTYGQSVANANNTFNTGNANYLKAKYDMEQALSSGGGSGGGSRRTAAALPVAALTNSASTGGYVPAQSYADAYNKSMMPDSYKQALQQYYGGSTRKPTVTYKKPKAQPRYSPARASYNMG